MPSAQQRSRRRNSMAAFVLRRNCIDESLRARADERPKIGWDREGSGCLMGVSARPLTVELIPDPELGGFTARLPDIPAYGEGPTEETAIADLREAIRGYIETFGLDDALSRLSSPSVRQIEWDLAELTRGQATTHLRGRDDRDRRIPGCYRATPDSSLRPLRGRGALPCPVPRVAQRDPGLMAATPTGSERPTPEGSSPLAGG